MGVGTSGVSDFAYTSGTASGVIGQDGVGGTGVIANFGVNPLAAYVANGFTPQFVVDETTTDAPTYYSASSVTTYSDIYTTDTTAGGLCTQTDSSGNLVWGPHCLNTYTEDLTQWTNLGTTDSGQVLTASAGGGVHVLFIASGYGADEVTTLAANITEGTHPYIALVLQGNTDQYVSVVADLDTDTISETAVGSTSGTLVSSSVTVNSDGSRTIRLTGSVGNASSPRVNIGFAEAATGNTFGGGGSVTYTAAGTETVTINAGWSYRSDLGGMADVPSDVRDISYEADYVKTTTAAKYLIRRRHYRYTGTSYVPTLLHEPVGATNLDPNSDDLSAWTTSNTTIAKNQTGADGVVNSAHSITANANNGTALEQITAASAAHAWGCLMKRITGAGTVEVTVNGGSTWVDITSDLSTSVYLPVSTGAGVTVTNPEFGVRLGTSGDVVAIQVSQLEQTSGFVSSPIPTTGASVTRSADTCKVKAAALPYDSTNISMAAAGRVNRSSGDTTGFATWFESNLTRMQLRTTSGDAGFLAVDTSGSGSANCSGGSIGSGVGTAFSIAGRWVSGSAIQVAEGGTAGTEVTASVPTIGPLSDDPVVLLSRGNTGEQNGEIDTLILWSDNIAQAGLEATTA